VEALDADIVNLDTAASATTTRRTRVQAALAAGE
jgi:hypothetical protein